MKALDLSGAKKGYYYYLKHDIELFCYESASLKIEELSGEI